MTTVGIPTLPERLAERYEVGPVIGRGVGSAVFRAHDTLLGRDAAIKTFRVETDPRAGRELTLLAMMDHPGLVPVYDVEEHAGCAFVVMALLDGGSLASRLSEHGAESGGLVLPEALRTGGTVAGALDHVHRAGVLHRAVTPGNVLYDGDGRPHLSDFGVAFVADAPRITDTGLTVGAAPYLAPEQVRGERAGAGADVYALGLVLIEALSGRRAFPGDPLSSAQARLDRDPAVPRGLPSDLAALIAAMTAGDPDARPDAAAVSTGLRRALADAEPLAMPAVLTSVGTRAASGTPARPSPGHGRGSPRATGTRGVMVLAGLAASAVLAGTVAFASSGPAAEITADSARPAAIVPGGATVGVPDPQGLAVAPLPAAPEPTGAAPAAEPTDVQDAAPVMARASRTDRAPVRAAAAGTEAASHPTHTRHSGTTHTASPAADDSADDHSADDADSHSDDHSDDSDEGTDHSKPQGPVGGVLHGVGGVADGVLGGDR